ncbi:MAG: thiamine-phosphate kinase [Actinobacteria bacterium]|nr:thiamine-phosphate kinase [Actinomycetota bacterium]
MTKDGQLVIELGERAALARAVAHFKKGANTSVGSGDDAAVVRLSGPEFVVTTDTMIQGHDFRHEFSSGFDLGYKAVATNVADVYAMGARPVALVVAMTVTDKTTVFWLEEFARGLQAGIDELAPQSEIVGGDLGFGPVTMIAVTAHGDLGSRAPILRSGAKAGDQLAICGTLGKAAAGLALLLHEDPTLAASYPELVQVQLRPNPPVQAVQEAFGQDWVLYGGEDHSFLATFAAGEVPRGFKLIGAVAKGSGVYLGENILEPRGWDSVRREAQS